MLCQLILVLGASIDMVKHPIKTDKPKVEINEGYDEFGKFLCKRHVLFAPLQSDG